LTAPAVEVAAGPGAVFARPATGSLLHVGVIMDGNGRWAVSRGLPRRFGHRAGAKAVRRAVEASPGLGIGTLTLYAFSCDNWQRPAAEVEALMALLEQYLGRERERAIREGMRLTVIGRRDRLRGSLVDAIETAEAATAGGRTLHLRLAVDYSGRDAILAAALLQPRDRPADRRSFERSLHLATHSPLEVPDLDLVIRTGGEQRLSDFLLWESAYAELYFTDCLWPDFSAEDLERAVGVFRSRERRFGAVATTSSADQPSLQRCESTATISATTRWRKLHDT
jgi:undecaprenyl diphosphate synthase